MTAPVFRPPRFRRRNAAGRVAPRHDASLVGFWPCDEANDTACTDESRHGFGGTLTNSPTRVFVGDRRAVEFSGASAQHIAVPQIFAAATAMTFSAWVRQTAFANAYNCVVSCGATPSFTLHVKSNGKLAFFGANGNAGTSWNYDGTGTYTLNLNEWAFLTAACTTGSNNHRGYVNGEPDGAATASHVPEPISAWHIGNDSITAGLVLTGQLRDARIYNRALSAEEVRALYRSYVDVPPRRIYRDFLMAQTALQASAPASITTSFCGSDF